MRHKSERKQAMLRSIFAGLLVTIMLFLEVATIFAAENNMTETVVGAPTDTSITFIIETPMTQDRFVIRDGDHYGLSTWDTKTHDFYTFPTNVPNFIGASIDRIYPNITDQIEGEHVATYRSNDDIITVTFYNPSNMKLDTNEIMVQSVVITPQIGTKLTIGDLRIGNGNTLCVSDFVTVFGEYTEMNSYITDEMNARLFWHFKTYAIEVLLEDGKIVWIELSDKRRLLPTAHAEDFYNFKAGELYRINVYDTEASSNNKFVTSFYVTKDEKEQMENEFFFKLYNAYAFTAGYLKQNETIEMLNKDNDYEAKISMLKNKLELQEEKEANEVVYVKPDTSPLLSDATIALCVLMAGIVAATFGYKYIVKPKSGR